MKLYEMTGAYNQILDMIEEGADPEVLQDTLDSIETAIEEKADGIGMVLKSIEANAKALKEEEQRLAERRRHFENEAKRLKEYLQSQLELIGTRKVKGTLFSFTIQKNPASLNVLDDSKIPSEYWIQQDPKLDKKSLIKLIKDGEEIEGVELVQSESLRVR